MKLRRDENVRRKVRVGVIGAGNVSKDLHLPVLANMDEVNLAWICDKDEKRAKDLAKLYRVPKFFNSIDKCPDVDIALVAIPVGYRRELMPKIFQRRWNAFCEKPFAVVLTEHEKYLSEAFEKGLQVGVGLVRRFGRATVTAKKIIESGRLGPMIGIWASEGARAKRTGQEAGSYMFKPDAAGGGVLMETGSHLVDQLCTILGVIDFRLERCLQRAYEGLELETRFSGSVSTSKQRDIECTFEISRLEDLCNGIFIRFRDFLLKCGLFFEEELELLTPDGELIGRLEPDGGAGSIGEAFYLEWREFIDQCHSESPSMVSADSSRLSTAIIEQCYKHAEIANI